MRTVSNLGVCFFVALSAACVAPRGGSTNAGGDKSPLAVALKNQSEPVLCAEKDNVSIAASGRGVRSFRIEVKVDNPQALRLAGASATLHVQTGEALAHRLSPALLSLDKAGRHGVKWVNEQQQVEFTPVQLISVDNQGAWVSGLPNKVALITLGQGFVEPGQQVISQLAKGGS